MSQYIQPPKSEDCAWQVEPPPSVGWLPASCDFPPTPDILRYHFGDGIWSDPFYPHWDAEMVEMMGVKPREEGGSPLMWCKPWWPEVQS